MKQAHLTIHRHPGESRDPGAPGTNLCVNPIDADDLSGNWPLGPGFRRDDENCGHMPPPTASPLHQERAP